MKYLLLLCLMTALHAAPMQSTDTETIYQDRYYSSAWQTGDYDGTKLRQLSPGQVTIEVDHQQGGFDASLGAGGSLDRVDQLADDFVISADFEVTGSGHGLWWYGPKVSVNWPSVSDGAAGWFENYIVDAASYAPDAMHDWIMDDYEADNPPNKYLGTTRHDGSVYRHYKVYFKTWVQFWAVRQQYQRQGATSLKPILNRWRRHGLPDKRLDSVKYNIETSKANQRRFRIKLNCFPVELTGSDCAGLSRPGPMDENIDLTGRKHLQNVWQNRYLHVSGKNGWADIQTFDFNADWHTQQWVFEPVRDAIYRIRNRWSGHYLTAPSQQEWDTLKAAELRPEWWSQLWSVTTDDGTAYRFQNVWTGLYLHANEGNGAPLSQAELRSDWTSMQWRIK